MKPTIWRLLQTYGFSPTKRIYCTLILLGLVTGGLCDFKTASSYEKNGVICYYCSPGYHWTDDCTVTMTQSQCIPCSPNTYQKSQNIAHYCQRCTKCDEVVRNYDKATELETCTSTRNTVCGCKSSYHFVEEIGGIGRGHCQVNKMCPAGFGVIASATNFSDTKCTECKNGITFSPSSSYDRCIPCQTKCPNNTHVMYPCNTTHDISCKNNVETTLLPDEQNKEVTQRKLQHSLYLHLAIGLMSAVAISGVLLLIAWIKCRRRNKPDTSRRQRQIGFNRSTQMTALIPGWMAECKSGTSVIWEKLFNNCPGYVMREWEAFIRTLFDLSGNSEKAQQAIDEAKEAIDREKVHSRIYRALTVWKGMCYRDDENAMFLIICDAVSTHQAKICCLPNISSV